MVDAYGNSSKVPIFERYFAGGAQSIRGYSERGIGPVDANTKDPVGGDSILVGSVEYTIPLVEVIKFATFFDIGNVWEKSSDFGKGNLFPGYGIGFRIKTPIGPMNLDYGIPLKKEPGEDSTGRRWKAARTTGRSCRTCASRAPLNRTRMWWCSWSAKNIMIPSPRTRAWRTSSSPSSATGLPATLS